MKKFFLLACASMLLYPVTSFYSPTDTRAKAINPSDADVIEQADSLSRSSELKSFTADATWMTIVDEHPASVFYDFENKFIQMDLGGAGTGASGNLLITWEPEQAGTYYITPTGCQRTLLPSNTMPSLAELMSQNQQALPVRDNSPGKRLQWDGSPDMEQTLLVEAPSLLFFLRLDKVVPMKNVSDTAPEDLLAKCTDAEILKDSFKGSKIEKQMQKQNAPWISLGRLKQTQPEYAAKFDKCWNSPTNCEARLALLPIGQPPVKYGWHCGPGWPIEAGEDVLDPIDALCELHDRNAINDCEFRNILRDVGQSGHLVWWWHFRDSYYAHQAITTASLAMCAT